MLIGGALEVSVVLLEAVGLAMTLLSGPIGIIGVIGAVGVAVAAYKHFKPFRKMIDGMVKAYKGFGKGVADVAGNIGKVSARWLNPLRNGALIPRKVLKRVGVILGLMLVDWFNDLGKKWSKGWDGVKKKSSKGMKSVSRVLLKVGRVLPRVLLMSSKMLKKHLPKVGKLCLRHVRRVLTMLLRGLRLL